MYNNFSEDWLYKSTAWFSRRVRLVEWFYFISNQLQLNIDFFRHYGVALFVPDVVFSDTSSSRVSTIVYKTLRRVLRLESKGSGNDQNKEQSPGTSGSNVISATILPRPTSPMEKPVKLVFNNTNKVLVILWLVAVAFWSVT